MKSLHIDGRRWFERTNGNTYHTVRIFLDGEQVAELGPVYGYGDQYLETALDWLYAHGHIDRGERHPSGGWPVSGTRGVREDLGGTYCVADVARKRDL